MKRYTFFFALLLVLTLPACDVLDVAPNQSLPTESVFTSGNNVRAALTGAYNSLQGFHDDYTIMADLASDNAAHTGSFPSWQEVDNYNLVTNNAEASGQWAGSYSLINIANNIIVNGPTVELAGDFTQANLDNVVAQAKVLRAYAYHNLVRWFGGVPILVMPSESGQAETYPARSSVDEVYAQIITDLQEAEATLGTSNAPAPLIDGWVAKGLLARVYLYRQQWQQAADKAQEVINGPFQLGTLSAQYDAAGGTGSIWELAYSEQDQNAMAFFAFPSNAGGRYEYAPTADILAAFDSSDARLPYNIAMAGTNRVIVKYDDPINGTDSHYALRLAEVMLTRAEALIQLGGAANLTEAANLIDQIRTRAGLTGTTATTQAGLLDAVLAERRLELAFEGHRWHDLVRTGRAVGTLSIPDASKTLWPIPQRDIDLNKNLTQNPSY